jgi:hypothetical protein
MSNTLLILGLIFDFLLKNGFIECFGFFKINIIKSMMTNTHKNQIKKLVILKKVVVG